MNREHNYTELYEWEKREMVDGNVHLNIIYY